MRRNYCWTAILAWWTVLWILASESARCTGDDVASLSAGLEVVRSSISESVDGEAYVRPEERHARLAVRDDRPEPNRLSHRSDNEERENLRGEIEAERRRGKEGAINLLNEQFGPTSKQGRENDARSKYDVRARRAGDENGLQRSASHSSISARKMDRSLVNDSKNGNLTAEAIRDAALANVNSPNVTAVDDPGSSVVSTELRASVIASSFPVDHREPCTDDSSSSRNLCETEKSRGAVKYPAELVSRVTFYPGKVLSVSPIKESRDRSTKDLQIGHYGITRVGVEAESLRKYGIFLKKDSRLKEVAAEYRIDQSHGDKTLPISRQMQKSTEERRRERLRNTRVHLPGKNSLETPGGRFPQDKMACDKSRKHLEESANMENNVKFRDTVKLLPDKFAYPSDTSWENIEGLTVDAHANDFNKFTGKPGKARLPEENTKERNGRRPTSDGCNEESSCPTGASPADNEASTEESREDKKTPLIHTSNPADIDSQILTTEVNLAGSSVFSRKRKSSEAASGRSERSELIDGRRKIRRNAGSAVVNAVSKEREKLLSNSVTSSEIVAEEYEAVNKDQLQLTSWIRSGAGRKLDPLEADGSESTHAKAFYLEFPIKGEKDSGDIATSLANNSMLASNFHKTSVTSGSFGKKRISGKLFDGSFDSSTKALQGSSECGRETKRPWRCLNISRGSTERSKLNSSFNDSADLNIQSSYGAASGYGNYTVDSPPDGFSLDAGTWHSRKSEEQRPTEPNEENVWRNSPARVMESFDDGSDRVTAAPRHRGNPRTPYHSRLDIKVDATAVSGEIPTSSDPMFLTIFPRATGSTLSRGQRRKEISRDAGKSISSKFDNAKRIDDVDGATGSPLKANLRSSMLDKGGAMENSKPPAGTWQRLTVTSSVEATTSSLSLQDIPRQLLAIPKSLRRREKKGQKNLGVRSKEKNSFITENSVRMTLSNLKGGSKRSYETIEEKFPRKDSIGEIEESTGMSRVIGENEPNNQSSLDESESRKTGESERKADRMTESSARDESVEINSGILTTGKFLTWAQTHSGSIYPWDKKIAENPRTESLEIEIRTMSLGKDTAEQGNTLKANAHSADNFIRDSKAESSGNKDGAASRMEITNSGLTPLSSSKISPDIFHEAIMISEEDRKNGDILHGYNKFKEKSSFFWKNDKKTLGQNEEEEVVVVEVGQASGKRNKKMKTEKRKREKEKEKEKKVETIAEEVGEARSTLNSTQASINPVTREKKNLETPEDLTYSRVGRKSRSYSKSPELANPFGGKSLNLANKHKATGSEIRRLGTKEPVIPTDDWKINEKSENASTVSRQKGKYDVGDARKDLHSNSNGKNAVSADRSVELRNKHSYGDNRENDDQSWVGATGLNMNEDKGGNYKLALPNRSSKASWGVNSSYPTILRGDLTDSSTRGIQLFRFGNQSHLRNESVPLTDKRRNPVEKKLSGSTATGSRDGDREMQIENYGENRGGGGGGEGKGQVDSVDNGSGVGAGASGTGGAGGAGSDEGRSDPRNSSAMLEIERLQLIGGKREKLVGKGSSMFATSKHESNLLKGLFNGLTTRGTASTRTNDKRSTAIHAKPNEFSTNDFIITPTASGTRASSSNNEESLKYNLIVDGKVTEGDGNELSSVNIEQVHKPSGNPDPSNNKKDLNGRGKILNNSWGQKRRKKKKGKIVEKYWEEEDFSDHGRFNSSSVRSNSSMTSSTKKYSGLRKERRSRSFGGGSTLNPDYGMELVTPRGSVHPSRDAEHSYRTIVESVTSVDPQADHDKYTLKSSFDRVSAVPMDSKTIRYMPRFAELGEVLRSTMTYRLLETSSMPKESFVTDYPGAIKAKTVIKDFRPSTTNTKLSDTIAGNQWTRYVSLPYPAAFTTPSPDRRRESKLAAVSRNSPSTSKSWTDRIAAWPTIAMNLPDNRNAGMLEEKSVRENNSENSNELKWPVKHSAVVEGDLVLGGLMMVHEREDKVTCGPVMPQGGVQALEAMLYTLDKVNEAHIVPGVKIGGLILDDCDKDTYGLEMAVDFIKGSISNIDGAEYHCNKTTKKKVISGVVGAASSVTSIQVANLLRLFRIPQVSFFSTSPELSNKQRFEYFTRTIPSDTYQVKAMVEIIKKMGWSYVSIIYEESNYGIKAFAELEKLLAENEICIAIKEKLEKDSGVAKETAYDNIVLKLLTKRARGCIIFGSDQEVAGVMRAVKRCNATGVFSWIGSDGWSARSLVSEGNEAQVEGTLSVQPQANPVKGFEEYFLNLTVENNRRNPWFVEFWEDHFQCRYPNASRTPYNLNYTKECTTKERLTKNNTAFEDQLQFVSDAVMAFAYAFRDMHTHLCRGEPGLCANMKPDKIKGKELLNYLREVKFEGLSGDKFKFDKDGDGPARYNIIHFKQTKADKYEWIKVGEYVEKELRLNMSDIQFRLDQPQPPKSVCSAPCEDGQAKTYVEGETCCWQCFNCTQYQIRDPYDETRCIDCPNGTVPDEPHTKCRDIPEEFLKLKSGWAIGAMAFSSTGISVTIFVGAVFLKYIKTPVVRASGRELSYVLLFGILCCYLVTFALVLKPTNVVCGIQRFVAGFSFTVVYAALFTKTNRIRRIFKASIRTTKTPSFISPRSQLIICSGLVGIQILINAIWMLMSPAKAKHYYPNREANLLVCDTYMDASYMIAFAYPILLIVVCTVYAVLTRKTPEHFNESKHIGFTMYTTCVIWLAFVPLYFGTGNHVALKITSMSVTISLSASVTIACLFAPKLYIILIHPDKNVRPVTMKTFKQNTKKNNPIPSATNDSSMMATITLTAATCDQPIARRIDCSTQSECYEMEVKEQKNGKSARDVVSQSTQTQANFNEKDSSSVGNTVAKDAKDSKENSSSKQLNNNTRIGNGPINQGHVSL